MKLSEFKQLHNIVTPLKFYPSLNGSGRFVAGFGRGGDNTLITKTDFDPKREAFVYSNPEDPGKSWILSNTVQKEAAFEM